MKFNVPVNNFSSGEWSPKMGSRTDTEQYARSCEEITNMIVQMQGGAAYRGNTVRNTASSVDPSLWAATLAASVNMPTSEFKLIPYKNTENYLSTVIIVYRNANFRVISIDNSGEVAYGANTGTAWGNPQDTQYQQVGDLLFITHASGSYKPRIFYYSKTNNPVKPSPFGRYRLEDIDRDYVTVAPWKTVPYGPIQALDSSTTIVSPATTTLNTDQTFNTSPFIFFTASSVGKYLRLANGTATDGVVRIKAILAGTGFTGTILKAVTPSFSFGSVANPTSFWQVSDWGNDLGWPKTVTAFQGRVIFGGNVFKPDTIWGSRIGNVFDMQEIPDTATTGVGGFASGSYTADNSRPFTLTPNASQSSSIVTLSSSKTLNIHTDQLEIVAYGSNGSLGPVNVVFDSSSSFGAAPVQPVRINNYATYVQANGHRVRDLTYNFSEDQYKSQDLGFAADHLFTRTSFNDIDVSANGLTATEKFPVDDITEICRHETRNSLLYCKTRSGKLYYVTLDRDYQINAWGRVVLGTSSVQTAPYNSGPKVLSMCVNPANNKLTLLVERTFNGVRRAILESFNDAWETKNTHVTSTNYFSLVDPAVYLDCSVRCVANPDLGTSSLTWAVSLLDGAATALYPNTVVSVMADGRYIGEVTLGTDQQGVFTIPTLATNVYIGFKYPGKLITSGLEAGGQVGNPVGRIKRIDELVVRLLNTGGCRVGGSSTTMEEIPIRQNSQPGAEPTNYFSGDKVVSFPMGYTRKAQVIIEQNLPYPMYVVSVTARGVTYD